MRRPRREADRCHGRRSEEEADPRGRRNEIASFSRHVERYNPAIVAIAEWSAIARYSTPSGFGIFAGRSLDIDVLLDLRFTTATSRSRSCERRLSTSGRRRSRADGQSRHGERSPRVEDGAVANLKASRVAQDRVRQQVLRRRLLHLGRYKRAEVKKASAGREVDRAESPSKCRRKSRCARSWSRSSNVSASAEASGHRGGRPGAVAGPRAWPKDSRSR